MSTDNLAAIQRPDGGRGLREFAPVVGTSKQAIRCTVEFVEDIADCVEEWPGDAGDWEAAHRFAEAMLAEFPGSTARVEYVAQMRPRWMR